MKTEMRVGPTLGCCGQVGPTEEDHWEAKGVFKPYGGWKSDPNWLWDLGSVPVGS